MSVIDPISRRAASQPEATAMIRPNGAALSYCILDACIAMVAGRLLALGISPSETVGLAISGPDESLALIVQLALARLGVAAAEPGVPARYLSSALVQRGANAPAGVPAIGFDESWLAEPDSGVPALPDAPGGASTFRIMSTSGTTGSQRFCAITHDAMAARVATTGFPVANAPWPTVLICAVGIGGAWGMRTALKTLAIGGTLVFTNHQRLIDSILRHKVTSLTISTGTLQAIVSTLPPDAKPLPPLRAILTGGSAVPARLRQLAAERLCRNVMVCYGATEVGTVAIGRPEVLAAAPGIAGTVEPEVDAQAVDASHNPLPPGHPGLLRFRTDGAVSGYLDDPATSEACFRDGWFYPGDLGAVTANRVLILTGRANELINAGGVKVNPREIEDVLLARPGVTQAAAFGVPDATGVTQIWAAIVADPSVQVAELQRQCEAALGRRTPRFIVRMKDLPRNASGKVMTSMIAEYVARMPQPQATAPSCQL